MWEAGEADLKEAMLLGFDEGVHGCATTWVSIDLKDLRGAAMHRNGRTSKLGLIQNVSETVISQFLYFITQS